MDRGATSDHTRTTSTHDYSKENHSNQHARSMMAAHQHHSSAPPLPPPSLLKVSGFPSSQPLLPWASRSSLNALHVPLRNTATVSSYRDAQDAEPWRASSSGFGLANLLNRTTSSSSSSSSAATVSTGTINNASASLPTFSLPSLHAYSAPFKSEHAVLNVRSPAPRTTSPQQPSAGDVVSDASRPLAIHTSTPPVAAESSSAAPSPSKDTTPPTSSNSNNSNNNNSNAARRIAPAPADDDDNEPDDERAGSIRGGRWTADEHERFLAGFRIHGHKWKRVQQVVRTRSVTQVRTHAQKYLLKVAKLQAEKKEQTNQTGGATADMATLSGDRFGAVRSGGDSSSDAEQQSRSARSSPAKRFADDSSFGSSAQSSPARTPKKKHKKARHSYYQYDHSVAQRVDVLDQEYIAAAATTLCFLMSQKIDSVFDGRSGGNDLDTEPFDCYNEATQTQTSAAQAGRVSSDSTAAATSSSSSSSSAYMHFLTDSAVSSAFPSAFSDSDRADAKDYAIEAKKLYS